MDPVQIQTNPPFSDPSDPSTLGSAQFPPFYPAKQLSNTPMPYSGEWDEFHHQSPLKQKNTARPSSPAVKALAEKLHRASPAMTPSRPHPARGEVHLSKTELAEPTPPPENVERKKVAPIDVFWAMVNDITGKDKLAKFGQYSLRLVLFHLKQAEMYLSDDKLNIRLIAKTYHGSAKILDLVVNFLRNPRAFARVLLILVCSTITLRLSGLAPALGSYRQFLRFGKSPFRIVALVKKVRQNVYLDTATGAYRILKAFFSKSTLSELISLYYSFNDELGLLFRLKFLRNQTWKRLAARHEAYAWYCDSWLAMYNAWSDLHDLQRQEMDMEIQIRVKQRARALSKELLGGTSLHTSHLDDDANDRQALKEIKFKESNAVLDIYKTLSDIIFNSYTVFNMDLHFATVQIWMGISASFLSSVKLYRQKKKTLEMA